MILFKRFQLVSLKSKKKVEENPGEETMCIKCDHCDKNSIFKNNLGKRSRTKQKRPYINIPFNCDVYQEHHDTNH